MRADYDVITIGGGLGGSAIARQLAKSGLRVLIVERETKFKDRVRGEWIAPWGAVEAQRLELYDLLLERCAQETPYWDFMNGMGPRDFRTTTPQRLPALTFFHPTMQEVVLAAAAQAGAEVWRGATVRGISPGVPPSVAIERDGTVTELTARMIVGADGRSSAARGWGGFEVRRASQKLLGAGLVLEHMSDGADTVRSLINPFAGRVALVIPQPGRRARGYLIYGNEIARVQNDGDLRRFVEECIRSGMPQEMYAQLEPSGPLASFDMTETSVEYPYKNGVALVGDAAGSSDPTWGQGLSLTLRDARVLCDNLLAGDDWDAAGRSYAAAHREYFDGLLKVCQWLFHLFLERSPEADKLRVRALPLIAAEPERVPDHYFGGPELPRDDRVRQRLFGEI